MQRVEYRKQRSGNCITPRHAAPGVSINLYKAPKLDATGRNSWFTSAYPGLFWWCLGELVRELLAAWTRHGKAARETFKSRRPAYYQAVGAGAATERDSVTLAGVRAAGSWAGTLAGHASDRRRSQATVTAVCSNSSTALRTKGAAKSCSPRVPASSSHSRVR